MPVHGMCSDEINLWLLLYLLPDSHRKGRDYFISSEWYVADIGIITSESIQLILHHGCSGAWSSWLSSIRKRHGMWIWEEISDEF